MALRYLDYVERVCWICWIMVTNTLIVTDSWCPFSVGYSSEVSLQRCFSSFADGQRPPTSALWCTQDLCFLIMHVLRTSSVCVFSVWEIDPKAAGHWAEIFISVQVIPPFANGLIMINSQSRIPELSINTSLTSRCQRLLNCPLRWFIAIPSYVMKSNWERNF